MGLGVRSILFAAVVSLAVGCTSPTLPLPPPAYPSESAGADPGTVRLTGGVNSVVGGSIVLVVNYNPVEKAWVTVANADGSYELIVNAVKGDTLHLTELVGTDTSSVTFPVLVN